MYESFAGCLCCCGISISKNSSRFLYIENDDEIYDIALRVLLTFLRLINNVGLLVSSVLVPSRDIFVWFCFPEDDEILLADAVSIADFIDRIR